MNKHNDNPTSNNNDFTKDIENQTFFIDGEYFEDHEISKNNYKDNYITYDVSNINSPLEKFKSANFMFENNFDSNLNFRKSQSYPNDYIGYINYNKKDIKKNIKKDIGKITNNILIEKSEQNINNIEMTQLNHNPLLTNYDDSSNLNYVSNETSRLINEINNKKKCCLFNANSYFYKFINYFKLNKLSVKTDLLNKLISVILHIFIMVVFEIYFYFNFVVDIEKEQFLDKIQEYIDELVNNINLDTVSIEIIKKIFSSKYDNTFMDSLYDLYIESLEQQKKILYQLMTKSCVIAGIIGLALLGFVLFGMWKKIKIKWNWIWIENILMFTLLGIFEYWFFMNVILNYNPITDAEIKYYIADQIINYLNSTA